MAAKKSVRRSRATPTIFTIGHSTRTIDEFVALLRQVAVDLLVDVRSIPRSRMNPQFNADALPEALIQAGIAYHHIPALGGLRHRKKGAMPSPNTFWRVAAFRNYADYAATDAFRMGLDELRALARDHCCAIMCAEAVWWRCHRRIIADYCWRMGFRWRTSWGTIRLTPRCSRLARNRPAGRSYIQPPTRRSKHLCDPPSGQVDQSSSSGVLGAPRVHRRRPCRGPNSRSFRVSLPLCRLAQDTSWPWEDQLGRRTRGDGRRHLQPRVVRFRAACQSALAALAPARIE